MIKEEDKVKKIIIEITAEGFTKKAITFGGEEYKDIYKLYKFGAKPMQLDIEDYVPDEIEKSFDNVSIYRVAKAVRDRQFTPPRRNELFDKWKERHIKN